MPPRRAFGILARRRSCATLAAFRLLFMSFLRANVAEDAAVTPDPKISSYEPAQTMGNPDWNSGIKARGHDRQLRVARAAIYRESTRGYLYDLLAEEVRAHPGHNRREVIAAFLQEAKRNDVRIETLPAWLLTGLDDEEE